MTDLRCCFLISVIHVSLGRGLGLLKTGFEGLDKGILLFDVLLPRFVSISRRGA